MVWQAAPLLLDSGARLLGVMARQEGRVLQLDGGVARLWKVLLLGNQVCMKLLGFGRELTVQLSFSLQLCEVLLLEELLLLAGQV